MCGDKSGLRVTVAMNQCPNQEKERSRYSCYCVTARNSVRPTLANLIVILCSQPPHWNLGKLYIVYSPRLYTVESVFLSACAYIPTAREVRLIIQDALNKQVKIKWVWLTLRVVDKTLER